MFKITQGKGFQMTFANGWTVSVQWGSNNYCENRSLEWGVATPESKDAEIAAWKGEDWHYFEEANGNVNGWQSPDQVAAFIALIAAKPL